VKPENYIEVHRSLFHGNAVAVHLEGLFVAWFHSVDTKEERNNGLLLPWFGVESGGETCWKNGLVLEWLNLHKSLHKSTKEVRLRSDRPCQLSPP